LVWAVITNTIGSPPEIFSGEWRNLAIIFFDLEAQTEAEETEAIGNRCEQPFSAAALERGRVRFELN
jgi:hypothetical protein